MAFALSGAARAPIQYFVSGRHGSSVLAPPLAAQLKFVGLFYVTSWEWTRYSSEDAPALTALHGLRRDHCAVASEDESGDRWHLTVGMARKRPASDVTQVLGRKLSSWVEKRAGLRAAAIVLEKVDLLVATVSAAAVQQ